MIKILKLKLENFMCVEHADLDFNDGVNLLIGNNGQGKSTVLQAITFCLLKQKKGSAFKDYITLGKQECNVVLDAEIKGANLHLEVSIDSKKTGLDKSATYNGKSYNTSSEVDALLDTFNLESYENIIMSMQNEGDITGLKPTARAEYLKDLLNFDFSDKIATLDEKSSELKKNIEYNSNKIEFNTKSIESRKSEIKETNALSFTDDDIKSLESNIDTLTKEISVLSESIKEKDNLQKEKTASMGVVYSTQQAIDKQKHDIELIKSNQTMIESLTSKISEYDTAIENAKKEIAELEAKSVELTNQINSIEAEKPTLEAELNERSIKRTELVKKLTDSTAVLANAKADVTHAQKHSDMVKLGTCPECGHTFDRGDTAKYANALKESLEAQTKADADLQAVNAELNQFDIETKQKQDQLNNIKLQASSVAKDVENNNRDMTRLKSVITTNESYKMSVEQQIKQYSDKISTIPELEQNIVTQQTVLDKMNEDVKAIDIKLSNLESVSVEYSNKSSQLSSAQQKLAEYNKEVIQNNSILTNNENIRVAIANMETEIETCKKTVEDYRRQKTIYDDAIDILKKSFPQYLILKTCQMLELEMNNFIQVIFPSMAARLFQSKNGVEFFYTTDKDSPVAKTKDNLLNAKMASGFEKAILSIAFKVALCRAYGIRFIFMDEIDQAGTEENSESMFKAILASDSFDQMFVISHKPSVRDSIQGLASSLKTFYVKKGSFYTEEVN